MTVDEELKSIESKLRVLDVDFEAWQEARANVQGSQSEVFQQVGENIVKEVRYQMERQALMKRKNDLVGVSDGVKSYLEGKKQPGKFEKSKLTNEKPDNTLNPFGGKALQPRRATGE